jgi:2-methylcitrate dehydratase PrpD
MSNEMRRCSMELTKALATNIVKIQYDDLPKEVTEATKRSILDTLGVMMPPTTLEKACITLADMVHEVGGKQESTLIGFGWKAPCWDAAFVNGSLTHVLDYDDTTDEPTHHPTAHTLPAALAIAERRGGVSGKEFITAVALGNDLGVRLVSAPKGQVFSDYPWFPITTFGTFTATAAAGKMLKLSIDEMINAFGLSIHRVFGISEAVAAPGSDMRAIRDGFTNKEGVLCALMAGKGIRACKDSIEILFKTLYRGEYDPEVPILNLGEKFRGYEAGLKPWPACRETHGYIQGALEIVKENDVQSNQIKEVSLTVGTFGGRHVCEPVAARQNPQLSIDAKFSMFFTVAVALTKGKVEISDFLPDNLKNSDVLNLAKRIKHKIDPTYGTVTPALIEIKTNDGRYFSKFIKTLYGHPENPLRQDDLIAKFKDCVRYAKNPLPMEKTGKLIEQVLKLEDLEDIREITNLL